ncbi:hypothetical protein [Pseudomonas frederiksbergensis]|uniref:hypothetical protein n=1 Tax=Pseudomonas frederiksbergensis TaxID=104087 RepID=UPI001620DDA6|nr:hypothetical protein [Pseudomonas frederiksbergensis]
MAARVLRAEELVLSDFREDLVKLIITVSRYAMVFQRIPTGHSFSGEGLFLSVGNGWFF